MLVILTPRSHFERLLRFLEAVNPKKEDRLFSCHILTITQGCRLASLETDCQKLNVLPTWPF